MSATVLLFASDFLAPSSDASVSMVLVSAIALPDDLARTSSASNGAASEAAIEGGVTGGIAASSRGGSLPAFGVASDLVTEAWVARRSSLGSVVWVGSCSGAEADDWSMTG